MYLIVKFIFICIFSLFIFNKVNAGENNIITGSTEPVRLVIFKFVNKSEFKGTWDLATGLTDLVTEKILTFGQYEVTVPRQSELRNIYRTLSSEQSKPDRLVTVGRYYRCRYVISPQVDTFTVENFGLINPKFGGYSSYTVKIVLSYTLVDVDNLQNTLTDTLGSGPVKNQDLAFLITDGGEWGTELGTLTEFNRFPKLKFGSPEWRDTRVGEVTLNLIDELVNKIYRFTTGQD